MPGIHPAVRVSLFVDGGVLRFEKLDCNHSLYFF